MKQFRKSVLVAALAASFGLAMSSAASARGHAISDDGESAPGHSGDAPGRGGTSPGHSGDAPGHSGDHPTGGGDHGHGPRLNPHNLDVCPDSDATLVGPEGQSGQSQVAQVTFSVAGSDTGESTDDTAPWARMSYFWLGSSFDFIFNAHNLEAGADYTLVVAADDGSAVCLGNGTVNAGGQLHLMGSVDPGASFPQDLDPFAPRTADTTDATARLVPSDSVDCDAGTVTAGDGTVLESDTGVRFVDVDVLECPAAP